MAGRRSDVQRALSLIEKLGSTLDIYINLPKCEIFSRNDTSSFPASMKSCHLPTKDMTTYIVQISFLASDQEAVVPIRGGCSS